MWLVAKTNVLIYICTALRLTCVFDPYLVTFKSCENPSVGSRSECGVYAEGDDRGMVFVHSTHSNGHVMGLHDERQMHSPIR